MTKLTHGVHRVAYRCVDAKKTVDWYGRYLQMPFVLAIAENQVPSTGAPDPYMHVFLDAGGGKVLAFFEIPSLPPMDRDRNTPTWVQHLAFKVASRDEQLAAKARLEADGIEVVVRPTTCSSTAPTSSIRMATASNWPGTAGRPRCTVASTK